MNYSRRNELGIIADKLYTEARRIERGLDMEWITSNIVDHRSKLDFVTRQEKYLDTRRCLNWAMEYICLVPTGSAKHDVALIERTIKYIRDAIEGNTDWSWEINRAHQEEIEHMTKEVRELQKDLSL